MEFCGFEMILGMLSILLAILVMKTIELLWWKPKRLEKALRAQGLKGTPYRFLFGDLKETSRLNKVARSKPIVPAHSHSIIQRIAPFLHQSMELYGKISFTWFGPNPAITVTDPELIREVLSNKSGHIEKPKFNTVVRSSDRGLSEYDGEKWVKHRRIINPAFHGEKLKKMFPAFSTCCNELISRWQNLVASEGLCELDIWPELQNFTGDVISRAAFGSDYEEGRHVFQLQREQAELFMQNLQSWYIPGYRFLPTSSNLRMKEFDQKIRTLLRDVIRKREKAMEVGATNMDDLLGLLLEANTSEDNRKSPNLKMTTEEVIGECKLFYFAGQETTSVLLTWTMIVLSMHPSWQVRAREEVSEMFGKNKPDFDGLNRLKIVTMILNEVLRLYPPIVLYTRRTSKTTKLGEITCPKGVMLYLPTIFVHHDPEFWGEDAHEFNPERFAGGVSKASKDRLAFFPFSWGPRVCVGQNFAMLEAKMCLSMILQYFEFELSPSYCHAPYTVITLQPQHGAPLILRKI